MEAIPFLEGNSIITYTIGIIQPVYRFLEKEELNNALNE